MMTTGCIFKIPLLSENEESAIELFKVFLNLLSDDEFIEIGESRLKGMPG